MLLIECGAVALVLASCGGGGEAPAPAPHNLRPEPEGGDEQPILVDVDIALGEDATRVSPRTVAAFLPLRFVVTGTGRVTIAGVGARAVAGRAVLRSPGLDAGRVRITGPGGPATLRVKAGGG